MNTIIINAQIKYFILPLKTSSKNLSKDLKLQFKLKLFKARLK